MYADIADQADAVVEQHFNAALARRVKPEPASATCRTVIAESKWYDGNTLLS